MASVALRQTRFDVGELAPHMYGRVDDPRYFRALRKCQNWMPTDHGDILSRPGTRFMMSVSDMGGTIRLMSGVFPDGKSIIFVFGNGLLRIIENGVPKTVVGAPYNGATNYVPGDVVSSAGFAYYCIAATVGNAPPNGAFWYQMTREVTAGTGTYYYEIPTPWTAVALPYLKKAQAGYTTTICYGGQDLGLASLAPRDLVRSTPFVGVGGYGFTIVATPVTVPAGVVAPAAPLFAVNLWAPATVYGRGDRSIDNVTTGQVPPLVDFICIQDGVTGAPTRPPAPAFTAGRSELDGNLYWMPTIDKEHQATPIEYVVTAVAQDANGVVFESGPSAVLSVKTVATVDRSAPISVSNPTLGAGYTTLYLKLYKGNNKVWGWVANAVDPGGGVLIKDNGLVPDFTQQPPTGVSPFVVSGGYSYPALVTYFENRRIFAGSKGIPHGIWGSASGNFYRWDRPDPGRDSDSYLVEINSEDYEELRSIVPLRRLVTLSGRSEFAVGGTNGALTRSNQDARRHSRWGSTWLDPIVIGNGVLFVSARNNLVRNFYPVFTMYGEIWDGEELSGTAHHLVELEYDGSDQGPGPNVWGQIVSWAFQSTPHPVVWMVRSDGKLLSMTYERGTPGREGTTAWAQHITGTGPLLVGTGALAPFYEWDHFEQVCSVLEPVGTGDSAGYQEAVYFCVSRQSYDGAGVVQCIEKLSRFHAASSIRGAASEDFSDPRYADRLDCAIQFDGRYYYMGFVGAGYTLFALSGGSAYADGEVVTLTVTGYSDPANILAFRNLPNHSALFSANDEGDTEIVFDPDGTNGIGPLRMTVVQFTSTTSLQVQIQGNLTAAQIAFVTSPNSWWALATKTFQVAHLAHWEPDPGTFDGVRGISAVLDGSSAGAVNSVAEPGESWFDKATGSFFSADPVVDACVGIAFNCDGELLDAADQRGEIRNRFKATKRIGFEASSARSLWVGQDFDDMQEWHSRQVVDGFGVLPFHTGYFEELIKGNWNKDGRAAFRHWEPFPCAVMGIVREMELGGT